MNRLMIEGRLMNCSRARLVLELLLIVMAVAGVGNRASAQTNLPRPDHIIVVVEENRSYQRILESNDAPYIKGLASTGASFTNFFALHHPSQPNYIEMFSGNNQGVTDDTCPKNLFNATSLGGELIKSGFIFRGYAEDLPAIDAKDCKKGQYARKHCPWADFADIPAGSSLPFTSFPTDFAKLPTLSFVIPNLDNDMHDGSVKRGDDWLRSHIEMYIQWAQTHNSLLVLTWDEDDHKENNRIPTIIVGQGIRPGNYDTRYTHWDLLRTIEAMYDLTPLGQSASASVIDNIWGTAPVQPGGIMVREWYNFFMPTPPATVHQLPLKIFDAAAQQVFTFPEVNFIATDNPLGDHPEHDISNDARKVLRDSLKSVGSSDLFFNGDDDFSEGSGPDLIGNAAAVEARKKREQAAVYWVRNKVQLEAVTSHSVGQVWQAGTSSVAVPMLPNTLSGYLQGEFAQLASSLTPEQQARLSGWRVAVGAPPDLSSTGESLWLKQSSKFIWLSPLLIRGLLLQAVQLPADSEYKHFLADQSRTPKLFGDPAITQSVEARFSSSIRYLLMHSIYHVVFAESGGSSAEREKRIDEMVAAALAADKRPTVFIEFLNGAKQAARGENDLWGVEAPGDGEAFMKKFNP